ncbi:MAG: ATP-binding protein [Bryobacteraceae bacterium]|nr:ATP-binding protein [Bryobacteraceae bacterium]
MGETTPSEFQPVDTLLDSTLESVDSAETTILGMAEKMGFDEDDLHKIGMSVREAMVNAVVHGNRYNSRKKVQLRVKAAGSELAIEIADEGEGFERENLPDPLAEENLLRHSGRGLLLIEAFMDEFQVRKREPRGTHIRMVKRLAAGG